MADAAKLELSRQLQSILTALMDSRSVSAPFLEPVDWEEWGLDDYLTVVKRPMDLGSIQAQLKDGQYDSFDAFDEDVHLVIDNCKLYNAEDSDVYKQALKLDKLYASQCKKLLKPEQAAATPASGGDKAKAGGLASAVPDRPKSHLKLPSADDKDRLCKAIFKLRASELGEVVHILDQMCPTALEKTGADEIDIDVDLIDAIGFRRVDAFLRECASKDRAGGAGGESHKKRKVEEE